MRQIEESITIQCKAERLFRTLCTPSEICMWWNARSAIVMPKPGGLWVAAWGKDEDSPEYITSARLKVFDPHRRLVMADFEYLAKAMSVPFAKQLVTEFNIDFADGQSTLRVIQSGFPDSRDADEFYQGCCTGWKNTLQSIAEYFQGPLEFIEGQVDGELG